MENNRIDYIDIAKGVGMLAIIWGHIMLFGWSYKLVYSFHIPLFFCLSGMCFNQKKYDSVWQLIKRRVQTLLIPYVIFSLVTWLIYVVGVLAFHNDTMQNCWYYLLQTVFAQGSGGYLEHNVALWFVTCLFVVDVLYYFISKLPDWANILVCLLCAAGGILMSSHYYNITTLPWSVDSALSAIPFFAFGNLMVKKLSHEKIVQSVDNHLLIYVVVTVLLTVFLVINVQNNGYISMGHNCLGDRTWLFYLNAFIGTVSTILFSLILSSLLSKGILKRTITYIRWLGNNSFYAMASHLPLKAALLTIPARMLHTNTGSGLCSNIWISLVAFIATLLVTSIVIQLINKGKELFAKRKQYK